jgi:hypothetical protein
VETYEQLPQHSQQQNQPNQQADLTTSTASNPNEDINLDFLKDATIDNSFEQGATIDGGGIAQTVNNGFISKDVFYQAYTSNGLYILKNFLEYKLKTKVDLINEKDDRLASDAFFDICIETPYLQFLIKNDNRLVVPIGILIYFITSKVGIVQEAIRAKKGSKKETIEPENNQQNQ